MMSSQTPTLFDSSPIDAHTFLAEYWQQKPLLIRQALPGAEARIDREQLFTLAESEDVESRVVTQSDGNWRVIEGPFRPGVISAHEPGQSLLVQAVDLWSPKVAQLKEAFNFLPSWRIDDIMVSYASNEGGVGPHFDYYDVFLIQGAGKRRWQLGGTCNEYTALIEGAPLKLLSDFKPIGEYILEAGDVLYVPPGIAHNGTAIGHSITLSVGFRSPTRAELFDDLATDLLFESANHHYRDPPLTTLDAGDELQDAVIDQLQVLLKEVVNDRDRLADWFARYMTTPKYPDTETAVPEYREMHYQGKRYINGFEDSDD